MFPRRSRLSRSAFPTAMSSGKRLSSAHFSAIVPKGGKGYAVVVSKKIARLSVTRHRIKRHVLEALRGLSLPPTLILFPKLSATRLTYQDIQVELSHLLSKIRD